MFEINIVQLRPRIILLLFKFLENIDLDAGPIDDRDKVQKEKPPVGTFSVI